MRSRLATRGPGPARVRPRIAAAWLGLVCAALAFGDLRAEERTVRIDNFTFAPERLTVRAGDRVTWTNEDDIPHAVAASERRFKSPVLDTDESFSFTFDRPGVYEYFCSLHPHMKATVVVE